MRTCAGCGGEIPAEKSSLAKYCNAHCRHLSRYQPTPGGYSCKEFKSKICCDCGISFIPTNNRQKRCNSCPDYNQTRKQSRRDARSGRSCKVCGGDVADEKRRGTIYCHECAHDLNLLYTRQWRDNLAIEAIDLMNDIKEKTS